MDKIITKLKHEINKNKHKIDELYNQNAGMDIAIMFIEEREAKNK